MSKFAVLRVEGLSSSGSDHSDNESSASKGTKATAKNKKQQQKKKTTSQPPVPAVRHKLQQQQQKSPAAMDEEWQRKDSQLAESAYERELGQAILASKLDCGATAAAIAGSSLPSIEADSRRAASQAVRHEKQTERDRLRREVEVSLQAKFQSAMASKEAEAAGLRAEADDLRGRLAASEAEAQRLAGLLSLVEGKKARGMAEQISQLSMVISELTEHTAFLDGELAKERTRCHQLQEQLDRQRPAR